MRPMWLLLLPRAHPGSEQIPGCLEGTNVLFEGSGIADQNGAADAASLAAGCSFCVSWLPWAVLPICREL